MKVRSANLKLINKQFLVAALVLSQALQVGAAPMRMTDTDATREEVAAFRKEVREDRGSRLLNKVLLMFSREWDGILARRGQTGGPDENMDMTTLKDLDKDVYVRPPTRTEIVETVETKNLANKYFEPQGIFRYIGSFIESGAPWSDGYQWNTHRWQGLLVSKIRDKVLDQAAAQKILNLRIGINTQDIDFRRPETVDPVAEMCMEMWKRGITPTLSVLFFPSLKNLRTFDANGKIIAERSYQNHPDFPAYTEKLAEFVLRRVRKAQAAFNEQNAKLPKSQQKPYARFAVNEINEPETDVGFNQFWRDALAKWNDKNVMKLYIPAGIATAMAKVRIRIATERVAGGEPVLYFHNEAMTPPDYPSHQGDGQFMISKFMLGHPVLMSANFAELMNEPFDQIVRRFEDNKAKGIVNEVEWAIKTYVEVPANDTEEKREAARKFIIGQLKQLQDMHHELKAKTGITARSRTMLQLDYYQQTEFQFHRKTSELVEELVKNNAKLLRKMLRVSNDQGILQVLHERVGSAEEMTGQNLRKLITGTSEDELRRILTAEDGIMLDKVVGFRNQWKTNPDPVFVQRRVLLGFEDPELIELQQDPLMRDERRIDNVLTKLVANDGALLKQMLQVNSDAELRAKLSLNPWENGSLREILSRNDRKVLHEMLGVEKFRKLGMLPPHFARQSRLNLRNGVYKSTIKYINELGVRVGGIGESGTPYVPWAEGWHVQAFMESVAAFRKAGGYFMRYDLGALVGAIGWIRGPLVKSIKENSVRAQDGVFELVYKGKKGLKASADNFDIRLGRFMDKAPWFETFRNTVMKYFSRAEAEIVQEDNRRAERAKTEGKEKAGAAARSCEMIFRTKAG